MGDFPSGQRGQTVNLLLIASVVRIHHPPPNKPDREVWFFVWWGIGGGFEPIAVQVSGGHLQPPVRKLVATIIFALGENANRIHHPRGKSKSNPPSLIVILLLSVGSEIRTRLNATVRCIVALLSLPGLVLFLALC